MPRAAAGAPKGSRPTATIQTGHLQPPTEGADTEAATALLERIAPWLAQALVDADGQLDLRIHLTMPAKRKGRPNNVYLILAAVYERSDQNPTLTLRKQPKGAKTAAAT